MKREPLRKKSRRSPAVRVGHIRSSVQDRMNTLDNFSTRSQSINNPLRMPSTAFSCPQMPSVALHAVEFTFQCGFDSFRAHHSFQPLTSGHRIFRTLTVREIVRTFEPRASRPGFSKEFFREKSAPTPASLVGAAESQRAVFLTRVRAIWESEDTKRLRGHKREHFVCKHNI